jgi:transaldolase
MATESPLQAARALERDMHDWARQEFAPVFGRLRFESQPRWQAVRAAGTTLWLDTGDIAGIRDAWSGDFTALTTNNTLLNKEVQRGQYDELVRRTAAKLRALAPDLPDSARALEIAFVLNVYHGLRLVEQFDAMVSVEEHTDLADDIERAVIYGKRLHAACPERFLVKLPLTPAGLLAMRKLRRDGVPVNFTLGFSARQNYLAARLGNPSYVNVFLGRLNAFVADSKLGSGDGVGEKATQASQEAVAGLRHDGLAHTLQIAASMRSGEQVWSLAGVDVMTIPLAVAQEYAESAQPPVARRGPAAAAVVPDVDAAARTSLHLDRLWDVTPEFRATVERLLGEDLDRMTAAQFTAFMRRNGAADLFPEFDGGDLEAIRAGGKIPHLDRWQARLESGAVGIDALVNAAGLQSFAADQAALDDRVRGLTG